MLTLPPRLYSYLGRLVGNFECVFRNKRPRFWQIFAPQARFFGKIGRFLPKSAVFLAENGRFWQKNPRVTPWKNGRNFKKTAEISKSAKIFELVKKFFRQSTQLAELRRFKLLLWGSENFFFGKRALFKKVKILTFFWDPIINYLKFWRFFLMLILRGGLYANRNMVVNRPCTNAIGLKRYVATGVCLVT